MRIRISRLLVVALTGASIGQGARAASYQKDDGTIVDPIQRWSWWADEVHPYTGPNLAPGAVLTGAQLTDANLIDAALAGADLTNARLMDSNLANADLTGAVLAGTLFYRALYDERTRFPPDFDPLAAGMVAARLINNGLAPPSPANVIDSDDQSVQYFITDSGCNFLVESPCVSPGSPTSVTGTGWSFFVAEDSSITGIVLNSLVARGRSQADVTLYGGDVNTYDSASVRASGWGDSLRANAFGESQVELSGGIWRDVTARDQSHIDFSGGGYDDDPRISLMHQSSMNFSGTTFSLGLTDESTATILPGSRITATIDVGAQARLLMQGGRFEDAGPAIRNQGEMLMTAGNLARGGLRTTGYSEVRGGSIWGAPEPTTGSFGYVTETPWNFIAHEMGLIDLFGMSLDEHVNLGARDSSRIRVFGSGFAVNGLASPFGTLTPTDGSLSGTLASGDPIDNAFAHRGADCGGQPCTGRILVLAPGLDWDQDAIPNPFDNCAEEPNADQADVDEDGTGDVCFSPVDLDRDGIVDALDNCRVDANPDQLDSDADGVGDACEKDLIFWADKGLEGCTTPPKRLPYELVSSDLGNGDVIDRSAQPCDCFGIEYPVTPGTASVRFLHRTESGFVEEYCENVAPFALGLGPNQPICADGLDEDGIHELMVTPYDAPGCEAGGGNALPSSLRRFEMAAPEPGMAVLVGWGALGLATMGRRRRDRSDLNGGSLAQPGE